MSKPIRVKSYPGPVKQLCWKQPPFGAPNPMVHCDRVKGHKGLHSWECAPKPAPAETPDRGAEEEGHVYDQDTR